MDTKKIPTVVVTAEELVRIIKNQKNSDSIRMNIVTEVKMNKTDNPLISHKVTKNTVGKFMYGSSYTKRVEEAVRNSCDGTVSPDELLKPFTDSTLPWGHWVDGAEGRLIVHTKKDKKTGQETKGYYIRYYNAVDPEEVDVIYSVDGKYADPEQLSIIEQFEQVKKGSKKQAEAGLGEERQVRVKNVSFNSLEWVVIDGTRYKLAAAGA